MYWSKRINHGFILLLVALFSMYGCAYQKPTVTPEKSAVEETQEEEEAKPVKVSTVGAYPTGDKSSSVIFLEKNVPSEGQAGQSFVYNINVTNLTGMTINDVEVIETISNDFDVTSSTPAMQGDITEGKARWFIGKLGPQETKVIRISGIPKDTGVISFCTDVKYSLPAVCTTTNIIQPELKLTKRAPSEVLICDTIPIKFVVTNTGTGAAKNVKIEESLPSGLKTLDGKPYVAYEVGSLKSGESREISMEVKAGRTGTFDNTAKAVAAGGLSAESNTTTTVVTRPRLTVKKTGPERRYLGRNITYDIVVSNEGDGPAEKTFVTDCIPKNASFLSASDGGKWLAAARGVEWDLGTLQPEDSRTLSLTVRADNLGKAENCATARAVCAEEVKNCTVTAVLGIPAVLLEVIDVEDPIEVGSSATYVVTVTNQGTAPGTNIRITCTLEDTMQYISSSGATTGSATKNTVVFAPLKSLAPKMKASWNINVRARETGDVRFKTTLNSDQIERVVEETESTHFYK